MKKKWGILIKKESESLIFTGLKIPRDYYINMEDHLLNLIYIKFLGSPLTPTEAQLVKQIDSDMLYFDMSILLNETSDSPAPSMKSSFSYEVLPFETVETRFLELYTKYRLI